MRRQYEQTHPWLTFDISRVRETRQKLWLMLGECQSKCEHIAGVPLRPDVASKLHQIYLAKGALATTAIEGNTLTQNEVMKALKGELELPPSREYLKQEVENIFKSFKKIWEQCQERRLPELTVDEVQELNKLVLEGLSLAPEVSPGRIREYHVGVSRYRGAPPDDCRYLLERLFQWIQGPDFEFFEGYEIVAGLIRAIMAHLYIAWIHPFGDGNGRTARLVEYKILLAAGVPSPAIHLLSNHYNLTRTEYYRRLDQASASGGNYLPFIEYAIQGFLDGLKEQIAEIRMYQLDVIWRNYVYEKFKDRKTAAQRRRRDLVLALSRVDEPVKISAILKKFPWLTESYTGTTKMVMVRDLNALKDMKLVQRSARGNLADKSVVAAFLPFRVKSEDPPEAEEEFELT